MDGGGLGVAAQDAEGREVVAHCQVQRGNVLLLALQYTHQTIDEQSRAELSVVDEKDRVTKIDGMWTVSIIDPFVDPLSIAYDTPYLMKGFTKLQNNCTIPQVSVRV